MHTLYSPIHSKHAICTLIACLIGLLLIAGCTPYERVVSRTSLLSSLEDTNDTGNVPTKKASRTLPDFLRNPDEGIRVEDEDGTITLYTKSIRQLMTQITLCIQNDERDLFVEQVLSQITKDEFYERNLDPGFAFDELVARQRDIFRMFYFMPMGEYTPGLFTKSIGRNVFRLQLSRARNEELYWIGIDSVFEKGNYRLRWFVP